MSSDESSNIDVGSEIDNPWGNMDVNDIPIEIVDNLNFSEDDEPEITKDYKGCDILFEPLNDHECRVVALKFNLVINESSHPVSFIGIGNTCPCPPMITQSAKPNGACLFNSFSLQLCGRDTYSAIIRHVVSNYISNPVKYKWLKAYLPSRFASGREYVNTSNMCNFSTWGTEVEIIALAQISGFDIYVFMQHNWLRYSHCITDSNEKSEHAFFLSNASGCHFDPIFNASAHG